MKNIHQNLKLALITLSVIIVTSCSKNILDEGKDLFTKESNEVLIEVNETTDGDPDPIILGALRTNPFTVEAMTLAYNQVHSAQISELETTDYYVKFMPVEDDDYATLSETGEEFYDYNLLYEVIEMGDYNPNFDEENPEIYAVVPVDFIFPNVPYEIINNLHLRSTDVEMVNQSFINTGNEDPPHYIPYPPIEACPPACSGGGGGSGGNTTGPGGCHKPSNQDRVAGRVEVVDTELGTEGVRRVKVVMKDTWFTEVERQTNDNGCFVFGSSVSNKIWLWVKMKGPRGKIRGSDGGVSILWDWMFAIKDYVGKFDEDTQPMNVFRIRFNPSNTQDVNTKAHLYWSGATVNNALHEFHDMAAQDNILPPPHDMDIFLRKEKTGGYALMANHIPVLELTNTITFANLGIVYGVFLNAVLPMPISNYSTLAIAVSLMPDVGVGSKHFNSDLLKWITFHEIAHASHFSQVGTVYWRDVVKAEINADGHGNANSTDAGLIAVAESWAEYISRDYTNRIYGSSNSQDIGDFYWLDYLEATHNETLNHIPIGLHNDLVDHTPGEGDAWDDDDPNFWDQPDPGVRYPIDDQVFGFSNNQMFYSLNANVTSPTQYKIWLINNYLASTGNTQADLNDLFDSY